MPRLGIASRADAVCLTVKDNTATGKMQGEKGRNPAECRYTIKGHESFFDPCPVHFKNENLRLRSLLLLVLDRGVGLLFPFLHCLLEGLDTLPQAFTQFRQFSGAEYDQNDHQDEQ
jgi:hypothetical protein